MEQLIQFVIMTFAVGLLWGAVIYRYYLKFQLDRGKLPKYLASRKQILMTLLKNIKEGGDSNPSAADSGSAKRLKAN